MTDSDPHRPVLPEKSATTGAANLGPLTDPRPLLSLLEAVPGFAMLLDGKFRIVASNRQLLEEIGVPFELWAGLKPGEALGCLHAEEEVEGCGTSEACTVCGNARAVMACLESGAPATEECRIERAVGPSAALDVEVTAVPIEGVEGRLIAFFMRDISGEKRRRVLERFFFHDVLNTAGACEGLSRLLADQGCASEPERLELQNLLADGMTQLVDEIQSHRQLMSAEAGELEVEFRTTPIAELVADVAQLCRYLDVAQGLELIAELPAGEAALDTDPGLLRRVLINLVKNALEATPRKGAVTLSAAASGELATFTVHNPTVMPPDVQLQIFKRSFSTKGPGRGVGTYSIKLLTEEFLNGSVSFTSDDAEGTTFRVALPIVAPWI